MTVSAPLGNRGFEYPVSPVSVSVSPGVARHLQTAGPKRKTTKMTQFEARDSIMTSVAKESIKSVYCSVQLYL